MLMVQTAYRKMTVTKILSLNFNFVTDFVTPKPLIYKTLSPLVTKVTKKFNSLLTRTHARIIKYFISHVRTRTRESKFKKMSFLSRRVQNR